jgi:type I restriction enzyme R subunit
LTAFTKSVFEEAVRETLPSPGWQVVFGPEIAPGESRAERSDHRDVLLTDPLFFEGIFG